MNLRGAALLLASFFFSCGATATATADDETPWTPEIPRTWDESALAGWPTPLAGLNARPTHISAKAYYSLAVENLRTYPVYFPGREPSGYWEMLQHVGPQPLIEPAKLRSEADWIAAGKRVFDEADHIHMRTFDPALIARVRSLEAMAAERALPDGTIFGMRWVPTKDGVALTFPNCSQCHLAYRDGVRIPGAPAFASGVSRANGRARVAPIVPEVQRAKRIISGVPPFFMGAEPFNMWLYRASSVPWLADDPNLKIKDISPADYAEIALGFRFGGAIPRWNGSFYFPAKVPDLIGLKDRKYIDHTATHLHRGIGDVMRYAALVSYAETADFGAYHVLSADAQRVTSRLSDEALYALALYIYSLKPPANPNPFDEKAQAGQKIFAREGCPMCHTPPLYTSNRVTLALGFTPPKDKPASLDLIPISVGTDPGLALKTRKGTGYYKVPSLKGVWYRGHYLHDGAAASLEEMVDPDRVNDSHVAGGWMPLGAKTHAIQGHPFGLQLTPQEREQLLAFLRTL